MRPSALAIAALITAIAAPAFAEPRLVSLGYLRRPGADSCPDESSLRSRIAARLGSNPFRDDAPTQLEVVVGQSPVGLGATVTLRERATSKSLGRRTLESHATDCRELADAMELAIALAIDPLYQTRPATEAPPQSTLAPIAHPDMTSSPDLSFEADARFALSLGEAPTASPGFAVGGRVRWEFLSVGLEARATIPIASEIPGGSLAVSQVTGALAGCGHYGYVGGCLVGTLGAAFLSGRDVPNARTDTKVAASLAVRALGEYPLGEHLFLRAHLDFGANLARTTARLGEQDVWTTPAVFGLLGLGAAWRF